MLRPPSVVLTGTLGWQLPQPRGPHTGQQVPQSGAAWARISRLTHWPGPHMQGPERASDLGPLPRHHSSPGPIGLTLRAQTHPVTPSSPSPTPARPPLSCPHSGPGSCSQGLSLPRGLLVHLSARRPCAQQPQPPIRRSPGWPVGSVGPRVTRAALGYALRPCTEALPRQQLGAQPVPALPGLSQFPCPQSGGQDLGPA